MFIPFAKAARTVIGLVWLRLNLASYYF